MSLPHKEVSSVRGAKEDWFLHQILIAKSGSFLQTSLFVLAHFFSSLLVVWPCYNNYFCMACTSSWFTASCLFISSPYSIDNMRNHTDNKGPDWTILYQYYEPRNHLLSSGTQPLIPRDATQEEVPLRQSTYFDPNFKKWSKFGPFFHNESEFGLNFVWIWSEFAYLVQILKLIIP